MSKLLNLMTAIAMALAMTSFSASAKCIDLDGNLHSVGTVLNIDVNNPKTIKSHKQFEKKHGVKPDGGAYKQIVCTFHVDLSDQDYPSVSKRNYIWVADTTYFVTL